MGFFNKKRIILLFLIAIMAVGGFFILDNQTSAQTSYTIEDIGSSIGLSTLDLKSTVINIIKWVLGIVSLVAVSFLIYGGILWMTSKGNEEKIAKAKKVIINTVIGIVIILLAWAIVLFVEGFVTNSSGGNGSVSCTPGDPHPSDICLECNASGNGYVYIIPAPVGCTLPGASFHTNDVETSYDASDQVYMCSRVQPIFNNNVEATTVDSSVSSGALYIENTANGDVKEGSWTTSGKSITFKHPKVCSNDNTQSCNNDDECGGVGDTCNLAVFEANTNYQIHLPNSIEDKDSLSLSAALSSALSTAVSCNEISGELVCNFTTNNEMDTVPPTITSTYPISDSNDSNYPDQNVNREPIIDVNFSENIDASTVIDSANSPQPNTSNIVLEQLDASGGNVVNAVDSSNLEIAEKSSGFRLSLLPPNNLEPFTWYRVTVQNIEDLCGNSMDSAFSWEFQTNDKIAGLQSWHPTGSNECPDARISFTFNTSMFDNTVDVIVNGQQIIMPPPSSFGGPNPTYSVTEPFGTLRILDPVPGDPTTLDPDNGFRVYELVPSNLLSTNTDYLVEINTDKVIDSSGGTLEKDWNFRVSTADDCTCSPYISHLTPDEGGLGECVTIHGSCLKKTTGLLANPTAVNFEATSAPIEASEENHIVTTSPNTFSSGDRPSVTVDLTYDNATYGTLTSNGIEFYYNTSDQANGPCLFSANPSSGYPGSSVRLEGIRFNPSDFVQSVTFDNGSLASGAINSWSDTRIDTSVPASGTESDDGDVNVENNIGQSNGIFFDIQEPPPGVPIVRDYWPNCEAACINTLPGMEFNLDMDSSTMTSSNISISECNSQTCDSFASSVNISPSYNSVDKTTTLPPASNLNQDTWYRVILNNNVLSDDGVTLGNFNYDADGDGTDDSFSWTFKTKSGADALCTLSSVEVSPASYTARENQIIDYYANGYGSPDNCDPSGQMLNNLAYNWSWSSSDTTYANVSSNDSDSDGNTDPNQSVEALQETNNTIQITASANSISNSGDLDITADPTFCVTDEDCTQNELGEACPGSTCIDNHCSAVINDFNPDNGAVGTWVTIAGCWFGDYVSGKSKVIFNNNKEGLIPNENICGPGTWKNYRIIREVPNENTADTTDDAETGPITIEGGDNASYSYNLSTSSDFTVNSLSRPAICSVDPEKGKENVTDVRIRGKNFGASRVANDSVLFHNNVEATNYSTWGDDNILTQVPFGAVSGDLKVVNDNVESNPWPFTVLPPNCNICTSDADCPAGQGCGDDGCCYNRPSVSSIIPVDGANNVCLNTLIEVNFDQNMNQSTLNDSNITLTGGTISYTISSYNDRARINLNDLLQGNTTYTVNLNNNIKSSKGVSMIADNFSFTTANTDDPCEIDYISLVPTHYIFTDKTENQIFTATAYDENNSDIQSISGVYDWIWHWSMDNEDIATVTDTDNPDQTATPVKNGQTWLRCEAQANTGWTGSKKANANIEVMFCDMPWRFQDGANNCDVVADGCSSNYNFDLFYCRGNYGICQGTDNELCTADDQNPCPVGEICCPAATPSCQFSGSVLPDLDMTVVRGQSGDVLKQYLFKESGRCSEGHQRCSVEADCSSGTCEVTDDGIGIRIYANPEALTPEEWYRQNVENQGSPQSMKVDSYRAVRDGRTIYVAATNYDGSDLYTNIYLISYNKEASSETKNIYNRLVNNWKFNINEPSDKEYIARDLERISDLRSMVGYLEDYRSNQVSAESSNLVQNSGFEEGSEVPGTNWTTLSSQADFVNMDTAETHSGDFSLKIIGDASNNRWAVQDIPTDYGKTYQVSAWIKTSTNGSGGDYANLLTQCRLPGNTGFNNTDCELYKTTENVEGDSGWVKRTAVVYANKADHLLRVGCRLVADDNSDQAWCDDFEVKEINPPYPALEAGTYIPGMTTSKWPSWQASLGNALGKSLPLDPINSLINCPSDYSEPNACWDKVNKQFFCDPGSSIYAYQTDRGLDYNLYVNLETNDTYWDASTSNYNICTNPSSCSCFDYRVSSP